MDELLREMEIKGLATIGSNWIRRAVVEQPSKVTLPLVSSSLIVYDRIDRMVALISRLNKQRMLRLWL